MKYFILICIALITFIFYLFLLTEKLPCEAYKDSYVGSVPWRCIENLNLDELKNE